jgi:hypothetical protein
MKLRNRVTGGGRTWGLSAAEQDEVWARWQSGESLGSIAHWAGGTATDLSNSRVTRLIAGAGSGRAGPGAAAQPALLENRSVAPAVATGFDIAKSALNVVPAEVRPS